MNINLNNYLEKNTEAAPLAVFRIFFGLMMFASIIRFWANGWIDKLYIQPKFFFSYYGFGVQGLPSMTSGMISLALALALVETLRSLISSLSLSLSISLPASLPFERSSSF